MCGIAGCVGHKNAPEFVLNSLEALEYRGYDSSGLSAIDGDTIETFKSLGGVANLQEKIAERSKNTESIKTAIGHTRWATHGSVILENTHPHTNSDQSIAIVHNGTIENYAFLKDKLKSEGYSFKSQTDTEVIPHLIDYYRKEGYDNKEAFKETLDNLVGAYAVLACFADQPQTLYAARLGSPLVLGVNGSEHFAASDPSVLVDHTKKAIFLEDFEVATLSNDGYEIESIQDKRFTTREPEELDDVFEKAELGNFDHYMIKEIYDSPETVRAAISGRVLADKNVVKLGGLEEKREQLNNLDRLLIVACGTSYHAGLVGERLIEEIAGIPVEVELASEFKYRNEPFEKNTAILAISQSGETADTIGALEKAGEFGMLKLGVINSPGSTIDRITDAGVHCRAGKEISVASTKAFTSQVTILSEIALAIGKNSSPKSQQIMKELASLPAKIEKFLKDTSDIEAVAEKYADFKNFLYVGRGYDYASALEGALKLKEISYIHAEGCGAGEMKHGTLALIDEDFPTFAIATYCPLYEKTISNIEEIKSRGGPVLALATEGNQAIKDLVDDVIYVPKSLEQTQPILNGIAMQLFAYYVAVQKDLNVDRPRNLAKSVTVE